jgi:hypothetical protein
MRETLDLIPSTQKSKSKNNKIQWMCALSVLDTNWIARQDEKEHPDEVLFMGFISPFQVINIRS